MGFRKLVERDGSGTVTLDKGDLALDGYVNENGTIEEAEVHVQRLGQGAYLVRAVDDGDVLELGELVPSI